MFFTKNKSELEIKRDMGAFGSAPREVTQYIVLFLDARSLIKLGMTNSTFYELIHELPKQIHMKVYDQKFEGTFAEFHTQYANYLHQKQLRDDEIAKIKALRESLQEQKSILHEWKSPSHSKRINCLTDDEKLATGCCFVFGTVGGILVSCFLPVSCLLSSFLGATAGGVGPLMICKTAKCMCGGCLACKEAGIDERENDLDSNFPPPRL